MCWGERAHICGVYVFLRLLLALQVSKANAVPCFSEPAHQAGLNGSVKEDPALLSIRPYWNISCPFKQKKYSCSHWTSALDRAEIAATRRFVPHECALADFDSEAFVLRLAGRVVMIAADSL